MNSLLLSQVESFLKKNYDFRKNVVNQRVEFKTKSEKSYKNLSENEMNSIYRYLLRQNLAVNFQVLSRIMNSNFTLSYDPIICYLDNLQEWDKTTDHISTLSDVVQTTDQDYWKWCFKKWFVALIASVIESKVVNHTVIVMSGAQGIGKSTFVNRLVPKELENYFYSGNIDPNNKDTAVLLSETMLINLDELECLNSSQISSLKDLITKLKIKVRKPYQMHHEDLIRRASFIGSINDSSFLKDTTGNRRFLCHEAISIDLDAEIDLDKVYAQGLYLVRQGFKYFFDIEDIKSIEEQNKKFHLSTVEEDLLLEYFKPVESVKTELFLNATQILEYISKYSTVTISNASRQKIGKALQKHNFIKVKKFGVFKYALEELKKNIN